MWESTGLWYQWIHTLRYATPFFHDVSHTYLENCLTHETYVDYLHKFRELSAKLATTTGLQRAFLISQFNMSFLNPEFYRDKSSDRHSSLRYETNRVDGRGTRLFKEIVEFLCVSGLCTTLGMSVLDVLDLDFTSYTQIKKIYGEVTKSQSAAYSGVMQDLKSMNRK